MSYIPIPSDKFLGSSEIKWIRCRKWATGGSVESTGLVNAGVLNDPLRDLWGNTEYLRVESEALRDEFESHLIDTNAHASAITNRIETFMASYVFSPQKIKAALSEDEGFGITNEDIEGGAEVQESKLHLELRGKVRPPLLEGVSGTYSKTSDFASDIMALYRKVSSHSNSFSLTKQLGEALTMSGWIAPIAHIADQDAPGAFKIVGNRIAYAHGKDSVQDPSLFVKGIPVFIGSDPITEDKPFIGNFLMECGVESENSYFSDLSSSNIFQHVTDTHDTRQDMVFLEFWIEDIPPNLGSVVPFGNTFYVDRNAGYSAVRYRQTSQGVLASDNGFEAAANIPENLVLTNDQSKLVQLKCRIRLAEGKSDLSECSPQGHLPVPVEGVLDNTQRFYADRVDSGSKIHLTSDSAELYTGNIIRFSPTSPYIPTNLSSGTIYYVIRPSGLGNSSYIQLAATYDDCYSGNYLSIPATSGTEEIYIDLAVSSHNDIVFELADLESLFDTYLASGEQWESGTPVVLDIESVSNVTKKLPEFFDDATYYVDQVRPGWIALYRHEVPHDTSTPLKQVAFSVENEEPDEPISGMIVLTSSKFGFSEDVKLCKYTLEKTSGYLRTDKEWGSMHPVSVTKEETKSYIFTESGEIISDKVYYVSRVIEDGNYVGILVCDSFENSLSGIGMKYIDSRLASGVVMTLKRKHVFAKSSKDPSCWFAFVSSGITGGQIIERSDVLAIPLFSIHRRNAGIFHPIYNPNGTAMAVVGEVVESVVDCFNDNKIATYNPDTGSFGTWANAVANSSEELDSRLDISSGKLSADEAWKAGTSVKFTISPGGVMPEGIEEGQTYWILTSVLTTGKYLIELTAIEGGIEPVAIVATTSSYTLTMFSDTSDFKVKFQDPEHPATPTTEFRTGYSGYKEKGFTSAGLFYGASGRPDGLYYDVSSIGDVTDLRNQLVFDGVSLQDLLSRNLDLLLRGANVSTTYNQKMSDDTDSGISSPCILQVDTLDTGDSIATPTLGSIINHKKTLEYAGRTLFSNDLLDGLRRTWSDASVVQNEADLVMFGDALNELPASFVDLTNAYGLGQIRTANFSHSLRLGDTVSPKHLLDIDFYVLKYRSLESGGTNKLALVGVKIARGGEASGDFEGAETDDDLRTVIFEPSRLGSPYRVIDIHSEIVGGITQSLKNDLQVKSTTVLNNGRSVDIDLVPFRIPKPLSYGTVYYLFEHPDGDGYYRLSTSLRPASTQESIGFVVDGDFMPGTLYESSSENTSTKTFDHGIAVKPIFSTRREAVRRNITMNLEESYLALRDKVGTGTTVRFSFPDDYSGSGFTYGMPASLSKNLTFYAIEDGRIQIGEEYYYRVRLAITGQDAIARNYIDFGADTTQNESLKYETGDLFFADIGPVPFISVVFEYPHILKPLSMAGASNFEIEDFSVLETGCPITITASGSDKLPKPFAQNTVYYVRKISDQEVRLCASPTDAYNNNPIEMEEEGGRYIFSINPGVYVTRNVLLPSSSVLMTGSDGKWNSGAMFRMISPNASGLMYLKSDGTEAAIDTPGEVLFYAVEIDSKRFRTLLAEGTLPGVTTATLSDVTNRNFDLFEMSAPNEGSLEIVPVSIGIRGNVVTGPYLKLKGVTFEIPVGTKVRVVEASPAKTNDPYSSTIPDVLNPNTDYYIAPKTGTFESDTQKVELALTYTDAYNRHLGIGNPTVINLSGIDETLNIQIVGFPSRMTPVISEGKKVGKIITCGGRTDSVLRIPKGTPVFIDYYSDSPTYMGRHFPVGLDRNRLYFTSEVDTEGVVLLYDSLRDIEEDNPIVFENPYTTDLFFQIVPVAAVEEVSFSSDHRLTEIQVPNDWPFSSVTDITGLPVRIIPTVLEEQFPIVSGVRPNKTYYAVKTSEDRIGLCSSFEEAIAFGNSDLVSFITSASSEIDTLAYMELVPQPVDSLGDPIESYTFSADSVNTLDNTVRVAARFLSGTPVYFNPYLAGSLGDDIQINTTYYLVVRRVVDSNAPTLDVCFVDSLEAANIYESKNRVTSVGNGMMKVIPLNRAEVIYTAGNRIVVLNNFENSWLRNTVQTSQDWVTGTPVKVQNVGEGLLPQYYEYGNKPSLLEEGETIDIPVNDVDVDLDTLSDSGKDSYSSWSTLLSGGEALLVNEIGNDIPSGLDKDQIYYVCGKSKRENSHYFKLAASFQDTLISVAANIRYVTKDGLLAISTWRPPVQEVVSMGSGYIDLSADTINVHVTWPSGIPVKLVPSAGSILPSGLSSSDSYFTYTYGLNKIQLIEDLRDFYRVKFGGYSAYGSTGESLPIGSPAIKTPEDMPRIIAISDTDTTDPFDPSFVPVIDSYLEGGESVRMWLRRAGETSPGSFTQIDKVRFGSVEISPDSGYEFFPYTEEGDEQYIQVVIPSYPQDSIVEVCVRKKTIEGDFLWSPPVMFVFTSEKMPILIKMTPTTVHTDWEAASYTNTFWNDFGGKISLIFYAPNGFFENQSAAIQLRHFAVGNTKPLPVNQDIDYIDNFTGPIRVTSVYDLSPGFGYVATPFFKIEFDYEPIQIEHINGIPTDEVLVMNSEVSIITNDTDRSPLSQNVLSLTNMNKLDATEVPFFVTLSAQKANSSPGKESGSFDFNKDLVFGRTGDEFVIRMITPGFTDPNTFITFEDLDTGDKEQRPAVSSIEYWNRNDDSETSTKHLVEVLYVSVPKRMSSSHTVRAYFSNNPDVSIDVPYISGRSPFIGHASSGGCGGNIEVEFKGDNLDSIDHVFLRVDFTGSQPDYKKKFEATVLRKDENSITIALPPLVYHENSDPNSSADREVEFEFCSSTDGSTLGHFTYKNKLATVPSPAIYFVSPNSLFGELYNTNKVKNEQGALITIVGCNLTNITSVVLTRDDNPSETYEVTEVYSDVNSCWFNLPVIEGIDLTTGPFDAKYKVRVNNVYGSYAETSASNYLKIKYNINYLSFPIVSSISPLEAFNFEENMIVVKGYNLSDTTSVQFGSQYLNTGQFSVIPGVGGGQDTLSFFSTPNSDKGMIQIVIKTNYGGSVRFASYPVYFFMKARYNVSIESEGSGDFEIQAKSWNTETFSGTSRVFGGTGHRNLLEVYQNLPTGLPVRLRKSTGKNLPYQETDYFGDGKIFFVVRTDLQRIKLRGKRTGTPVSLSIPSALSREPLVISDINIGTNILTTSTTPTNWANGQEVYLIFSSTGTDPEGIFENKSYWISELSGSTFKLLDSPTASSPVDITLEGEKTVTVYPISGTTFTLIDLPTKEDPLNPENKVVDWDQGIARFCEQINLSSFFVDGLTNTLVVKSRFWDTDKTIGLNPYYPPFLEDESHPVPVWARTTDKLPTESISPIHKSGYLFAREGWDTDYESGVDEELEYQIDPSENPTTFIGLAQTFLGSISQSPQLVPFITSTVDTGFTLEVVTDDVAELFLDSEINPALDEFKTSMNIDYEGWTVGTPVVLGSKLPSPLEDGKIYYNAGDSSKIVLKLDQSDTSGTHVDLLDDIGYGFFRLTPTYTEFSLNDTYYVEDVGNGRIRFYKSLLALLDGNYLRLMVSNETEMLIKPISEIDVLSLEESTFDLTTGEILDSSSNIVSGMPISFEAYDEVSELPDGIEANKVYYVYRPSQDAVALFNTWREVALLEGHTMLLTRSSSAVTMKLDFTGERVLQTISGSTPNIAVSDSKIKMTLSNSHSDPQGTPVILVSDKPILGKEEMLEQGRGVDVRFYLRYAPGCGLTDRSVNLGIESRKGTELPTVKTTKDSYVVLDPRMSCASKGSTAYWRTSVKDVLTPIFDKETLGTYFDDTTVPKSRHNTAMKGFFHAIDLMDAIIPGPISMGSIPLDRTTITKEVENTYMGYDGEAGEYYFKYDDFLPGNLRGHDIYVAWVGIRIDEIDELTEQGVYTTTYAGFPVVPVPGRVSYDPEYVIGKIKVTWNKETRSLKITGMTNQLRLTFRVGICSVDYENNADIPPYLASTYSGTFDVGYIYESDMQCKEISLVGSKRILRTKDFGLGYGWGLNSGTPPSWYAPDHLIPDKSRGFSDVCGYTWTAWKQVPIEPPATTPSEFELKYTKPTDAYFEGEGDLDPDGDVGDSTELMYFAGWTENPIPAIPVKPSDGRVYVYYDRNPVKFDHSITAIEKILRNDYAILSMAGSGNYRPSGDLVPIRYQYPFSAFHIPTPDPTYFYRITGRMLDPDANRVVSIDPSFVKVSVIGLKNNLLSYPMSQFETETDSLFTPEYAPKNPVKYETRTNPDGTLILIPNKDATLSVTTYPAITSRGSEMLTILPNLVLDGRELKGVLLVSNGKVSVEAKFRLHGRPIMRSNMKGL